MFGIDTAQEEVETKDILLGGLRMPARQVAGVHKLHFAMTRHTADHLVQVPHIEYATVVGLEGALVAARVDRIDHVALDLGSLAVLLRIGLVVAGNLECVAALDAHKDSAVPVWEYDRTASTVLGDSRQECGRTAVANHEHPEVYGLVAQETDEMLCRTVDTM